MSLKFGFALAVLALLALAIIILMPALTYLKHQKWSNGRKRIVFSVVATFLFFPVMTSPEIIGGIPVPNIIFIIFSFKLSLAAALDWYLETYRFSLVSSLITFLLFSHISSRIFPRQDGSLGFTDMVSKSWTLKAIFLYIIFIALQVFPYSGLFLMFAMALAGPIIWGLIPHLLTAVFLLDISLGRFPKHFLVFPILIYGAYYTAYLHEGFQINNLEAELKSQNPNEIIAFDPTHHSLVMVGAESLYPYSKIPVVYEPNENFLEGYMSIRMVNNRKSQEFAKLKMEWHRASPITVYKGGERWDSKSLDQSKIRMPEKPDKNIIEIVREEVKAKNSQNYLGPFKLGEWGPVTEGQKTIYTFKYQYEILGKFTSYRTARMPAFPMIMVGCGLNSGAASWDCFAGLEPKTIILNTLPDKVDVNRYGTNPVNAMLQIEIYQNDDFSNFVDYPENIALIDNLIKEKNSEKPEDFNEWGIKKNSPTIPLIGNMNGIPSYSGKIYSKKEGGPFYAFIQDNTGKIVYIDAGLDRSTSSDPIREDQSHSFFIYGVCRNDCIAGSRVYRIHDQGGATFYKSREGLTGWLKGYWIVGEEKKSGSDITIDLNEVPPPGLRK